MVVVNRCWLCESKGELVDHLLIHCAATSGLWNAQLFGKWSLIILCGVFGGSKIIDVSRTR
jgi:hypothetical protein